MELRENEIIISEKPLQIKPVKLKYMKNGFYGNYMALRKLGTKIFNFSDAEDFIKGFLKAVLDTEEVEDIYDNIEMPTLIKMLEITKKINDIEDEVDIKNE